MTFLNIIQIPALSFSRTQKFALLVLTGVILGLLALTSWVAPLAAIAAGITIGLVFWSPLTGWGLLMVVFVFGRLYTPVALGSLLFWGLLALFCTGVWGQHLAKRQSLTLGNRMFWTALFGWFAWGIIAASFSPDIALSTKEMCRYGIGLFVLLTYVLWLRNQHVARQAIALLWILLVPYCTLFTLGFFYGKFSGQTHNILLGLYPRPQAEIGVLAASFLPVFASLIRDLRGALLYKIGGLLALLSCAVLSNSAASALAAVVGLLALPCIEKPALAKKILSLASIALSSALCIGFIFIENISELLIFPLSGRERIWTAALTAIKANPLLGVGPGRWSAWFGANHITADLIFPDKNGNSFFLNPLHLKGEAHNLFLTKAAESGIPALTFLICMFIAWFIGTRFLLNRLARGWNHNLVRGCLASFLGLTSFCFFENGPIIGVAREGQLVVVMLILAIPLAIEKWRQVTPPTMDSTPKIS